VLEYSFMTRSTRADQLWKTARTAEEGYNSPTSAWWRTPFVNAYQAMKQAGLWIYVENVVDVVPANVQGIRFKPDAPDLAAVLSGSQAFCKDGSKWRQVVPLGSAGLHIFVQSAPVWEAHIDTVAPVKARKSDGQCSISYGATGIRHVWEDLWGHKTPSK
jgi:hypothetical protein